MVNDKKGKEVPIDGHFSSFFNCFYLSKINLSNYSKQSTSDFFIILNFCFNI